MAPANNTPRSASATRFDAPCKGVLTAVAAFLALNLFAQPGPTVAPAGHAGLPGAALADPPADEPDEPGPGAGLVSAADQRKIMIAELRALSKRIEQLQARLDKGISVKVAEMPEVRIQGAPASK